MTGDDEKSANSTVVRALHLHIRTTAFDYADFLLYVYAVGAYVYAICSSEGIRKLPGGLAIASLASISIVFLYVLARNYLVMRSIDHHEVDPRRDFAFVSAHFGVFEVLERLVRLLIILVVILTPKEGYIKIFTSVFDALAVWMKSKVALIPGYDLFFTNPNPTLNDVLHVSIPYYGAVMFVLFLLFLAWDVVNIAASRYHISEKHIVPRLIGGENIVLDDAAYRALLCYMNICKRRRNKGDSIVSFPNIDRIDKAQRRAKIEHGHIWKLYLTSPKAGERAFGMLVGWAMVLAGEAEFTVLPTIFLMGMIGAYFACVSQNEAAYRGLLEYRHLIFGYFLETRWRPVSRSSETQAKTTPGA